MTLDDYIFERDQDAYDAWSEREVNGLNGQLRDRVPRTGAAAGVESAIPGAPGLGRNDEGAGLREQPGSQGECETMQSISEDTLRVNEVQRPNSVSFTKTAKGGWRADGVKVHFALDEREGALSDALGLMRLADRIAQTRNDEERAETNGDNEEK